MTIADTGAAWVEEDHILFDAQKAWGLPLPYEVDVHAVGADVLAEACEAPAECQPPACVIQACVSGGAIWLHEDLPEERFELVLRHELGHVYHGPGHVVDDGCPADAPGEHLMCLYGNTSGEVTDADLELVLGANGAAQK